MDTLETLRKRIATTEDLQSIVGTMKALSAVSIRQYEEAVAALRDYSRTIELGLQVVLQRNGPAMAARATVPAPVLAIVFGSDHGLCGRFNHEIAHFAQRALADAPAGTTGPLDMGNTTVHQRVWRNGSRQRNRVGN